MVICRLEMGYMMTSKEKAQQWASQSVRSEYYYFDKTQLIMGFRQKIVSLTFYQTEEILDNFLSTIIKILLNG